jgi:hypothetical protein
MITAGFEEAICLVDVSRTAYPRNTSERVVVNEAGGGKSDGIVFSTTDIPFTNMQTLRVDFQSDPGVTITSGNRVPEKAVMTVKGNANDLNLKKFNTADLDLTINNDPAFVFSDSTENISGTVDGAACTKIPAVEEVICTKVVLQSAFPRNTTETRLLREFDSGVVSDGIVISTTDIPNSNMQTLRIDFQSDPNVVITSSNVIAEKRVMRVSDDAGKNDLHLRQFKELDLTIENDFNRGVPEPGTASLVALVAFALLVTTWRKQAMKRLMTPNALDKVGR